MKISHAIVVVILGESAVYGFECERFYKYKASWVLPTPLWPIITHFNV